MLYLSKIEKKNYNQFKKNKGDFSIKFRMNAWINHLNNEFIFKDVFSEYIDEDGYKKMELNNHVAYKLEVDDQAWSGFQKNCESVGISANLALNKLVEKFNNEGSLFEVKVLV